MTPLVNHADRRLTYIGEEGCRRQIISDPKLLERLRQQQGRNSTDRDGGLQS